MDMYVHPRAGVGGYQFQDAHASTRTHNPDSRGRSEPWQGARAYRACFPRASGSLQGGAAGYPSWTRPGSSPPNDASAIAASAQVSRPGMPQTTVATTSARPTIAASVTVKAGCPVPR